MYRRGYLLADPLRIPLNGMLIDTRVGHLYFRILDIMIVAKMYLNPMFSWSRLSELNTNRIGMSVQNQSVPE